MTNDEMIAVLQVAKEGKAIQCRYRDRVKYKDEWMTAEPHWNFPEFDYRVAPEPREFWVPEGYVPQWDRDYRLTILYAKSREECLAYWPRRKPVLFREVL